MALKSIVLHVGAHKTGTSLVQKFLRDREKLCTANNIYALPRGDGSKFIGWAGEERIAKGREPLLRRIQRQTEHGRDYFLISHENSIGRPFITGENEIYPHRDACIARLKGELEGHAFRVIYYIRRQAWFLESYYLQTVHEGGMLPFRDWQKAMEPPSLSWKPVYESLCAAFGDSNVVLRSFEQEIALGQSAYLRRFFESFMPTDPAKWKDFEYEPVHNPSVGSKGLEIALAINRLSETTAERKLVRKFLQDNFSNRNYPRPLLLEEGERDALNIRYDDENKVLIERAELRAA